MKKFILVFVAVFLLVLGGCKGVGVSEKRLDENFHKGTSGIELNFIKNAPPSRVYEGDSLDISV